MKIYKKSFIRSMLFVLACFYGNFIFAQGGCCSDNENHTIFFCDQDAGPEAGKISIDAVVDCSYDNLKEDENLFRPYIPNSDSDIITIRLIFQIVQKGDGSGNFQNNMNDIAFLYDQVERLNSFLSEFQAPIWGGKEQEVPYIVDSRIRCVLDKVYFIRDDEAYGTRPIDKDTGKDIYYTKYRKEEDHCLNVFFTELPPSEPGKNIPLGGNGFGLWGEKYNCILLYGYYNFYHNRPHDGELRTSNFAHELGHQLGLYHTFEGDYLSDTNNDEPGINGWCDLASVTCSNNLMGDAPSKRHLSPLQAGKMRKLLTEGWRSKMHYNSGDNATPQTISTNVTWNVPRAYKGGLVFQGTMYSPVTAHINCNVYLPADKHVTINSRARVILDGGIIKNNFGEKTNITIYNGGCLEISSSVLDNCRITVKEGGTLIINHSLTFINKGQVDVEPGGYICVKSTANLHITSKEEFLNLQSGHEIGVNSAYVTEVTDCPSVSSWKVSGNGSVRQPGDLSVLTSYPVDMSFGGITDWGINVADVTGNGKQELFFASRYGHLSALDYRGKELYNIDNDPNTYSGFASFIEDGSGIPAIGDLYGDGKMYVVQPTRDYYNAVRKNVVYCYSVEDRDKDGKPDLTWQNASNPSWAAYRGAVLANIDNSTDGSLEVIVGHEGGQLAVYSANGTLRWTARGPAVNYGAIAVADLDGDGKKEIIMASGYGIYIWRYDGSNFSSKQPVYDISGSGYRMRGSVVVCDLTNDGKKEIVFASVKEAATSPSSAMIHVIKPDGTPVPGWASTLFHTISKEDNTHTQEVVVGDLDGDGDLEVVAAGLGMVKVWNNKGALIHQTNIPGMNVTKTPILADIDGGNDAEILLSSRDGYLYALKMDGSMVPGFPIAVISGKSAPPCVADIDGDGKNELMLAIGGTGLTRVYVWKTEGRPENNEWPRERHNQHNTGEYTPSRIPVRTMPSYPVDMSFGGITDWGINVVDMTGDGKQELFFASRYGHLSALDYQGRELYKIGDNPDAYAGFTSFIEDGSGIPAIGDLNNTGKMYVVQPTRDYYNAVRNNAVYCYSVEDRDKDGKPDLTWQDTSNPSWAAYRGAVLANIDNSTDGSLEVIVGHEGGQLAVYSANGTLRWTARGPAVNYGAIAVADLDGDGKKEIIMASGYGIYIWRYDGSNFSSKQPVYDISGSGYRMRGSVVVCDLTNDGKKEIVFASVKEAATSPSSAMIHVIKPDGTPVPGWASTLFHTISKEDNTHTQEVVVGDLDGDGDLEVVAAGLGMVKVWNNKGALIHQTNIPGMNVTKTPILADIDGGNDAEILLSSRDGYLYALKMDGSMVPGFPIAVISGKSAPPCVADIDGDGKNELMLAIGGTGLTRVYVWKTEGRPENNEWPRERHNQHNTGEYSHPGTLLRATSLSTESLLKNGEVITGISLPMENSIYVSNSSGGITIESTPERISAIRLLDISGKKIAGESNLDTYQYLLPKISSGVYILNIELESGKRIVKKVIF
ncbi:MAG: FG-GAP-like repeat-containing protein [Candidatus Azobacteroides sp.]|nr:FG-GAP-like repeat-containing protein [Candidatus Azobacteroides sp.]